MTKIIDGIVYSNDVLRIMNGNNPYNFKYSDNGIIVPKEIKDLEKDFERDVNGIFNNKVTIIEENEMLESIYNSIDDVLGVYPIVSLDRIYLDIDNENIYFLDCTRLNGSNELVSRISPNERENVSENIKRLSFFFRSKGINEIVLADDVVFSGNVLRNIINEFKKNGINVIGIRSCISTNESYNYFNSNLPLGLKSGYLLEDSVIDQICQRDFYFGILGSGVLKEYSDGLYKAPYFYPFGDCVERASIPKEFEKNFSDGCLRRSELLWEEIERLSNRKIYLKELLESIYNTDINNTVIGEIQKVRRK